MINGLNDIISGALARLGQQIRTDLPPFLAALAILIAAYLLARVARWMVLRAFKGIEVDQWLRRSGISVILNREDTLRASRVAAQVAYWGILLAGAAAALNVFGTQVTTRLAEWVMMLLPRLVAGAAILIAGLWLGQYAGRSVLVWAVNEDVPSPRKLAVAARALVVFAAIVVAAEMVDFAKDVFLTSFLVILSGVVLTASLAFGLGARDAVRRHLEERSAEEHVVSERSLWNHL